MLLAAFTALGGCVSIETIAPQVNPALLAAGRGTSQSELAEGRRIYTAQCTTCHTAEPVMDYKGRWPEIIEDMAPKTKLNAAQTQAVLRYVLAAERITPMQ